MKLIAVGNNHITNTKFEVSIDAKLAVELMLLTEAGEDEKVDAILHKMGNRSAQARVLDSFTWIDYMHEAIMMLVRGNRFAVRSNEVEFGIAADRQNAQMALWNEEF